jgi:hypothetical protein
MMKKFNLTGNFRAWRCPHARTPHGGVGSRHRLREYQLPGEPALDRKTKFDSGSPGGRTSAGVRREDWTNA